MGDWNMPPGISEADIPGNRPEDQEWDGLFDWLADSGLTPTQIREAVSDIYGKHLPKG